MDRKTLEKQREKLLEELKVINKQLGIRSHIAIEEIRDKVKEFTGIDVKNLGTKCTKKAKLAKQIFWRAGFLYSYSGTELSEYCGMKSRFSAISGRNLHIDKCKQDRSLDFDWKTFKNKL
jgi:hypothetical protein